MYYGVLVFLPVIEMSIAIDAIIVIAIFVIIMSFIITRILFLIIVQLILGLSICATNRSNTTKIP